MGITKTDLFTEEQNELANMAKALAHPARVAILEYLLKAQQCINSDLVDELGLAQPTVSQHLKELKALGIIEGTVEGTSMCYCINRAGWEKIMAQSSDNSWKDEAWTILFIVIIAMCFIPFTQPYVERGFASLSATPDWFQYAVYASIAASFGLRGLKGVRK